MAVVGQYTGRTRAAGPSGIWPGGQSIYDRGLAAWSDVAAGLGQNLARRDAEIKAAHESSVLVSRTAQYTLQLDDLLNRTAMLSVDPATGKPMAPDAPAGAPRRAASPEEQDAYFQQEAGLIEKAAAEWKGASPEAAAKLNAFMTDEMAQKIGALRSVQRQRRIQDIKDNATNAINVAIATGNLPLMQQSVNDLNAVGELSDAKAEQEIARFQTNVKIYAIRKQLTNLDGANVPIMQKIDQANALSNQASELLAQDLPVEQRNALLNVKNVAEAYTSQSKAIAAETLRQNDLSVMSRTLATVRGAATGDNAVTFEQLEAAMDAGVISREVGTMAWDRLARKNEVKAEKMTEAEKQEAQAARLRAYRVLSQQTNKYKQGLISYREWSSSFEAQQGEVSEEDAEKFIDMAAAKQMTEADQATVAAEKLAETTLKPLFFGTQASDTVGLDQAIGYVMQRIDKWRDETFTADKPFDEVLFRRKASEILDDTYRDWAKQIRRGKEGTIRPTYPNEGQRTPEELRRLGTREAYEEGVKLGYWK